MGRFTRREKPVWVEAGPIGPLTVDERQRFTELCGIIDRGMVSWIEVGKALYELMPGVGGGQRLYRETHRTFDEFVRDRWGFGRNYAGKLVNAAYQGERIQKRLTSRNPSGTGTVVPPKLDNLDDKTAPEPDDTAPVQAILERHVRAMRDVPREKEAEVIDRAMDYGGQLTAAKIAQAVKVVMGDGDGKGGSKLDVVAALSAAMKAVVRLQRDLQAIAEAPGGEQLRPGRDVRAPSRLAPEYVDLLTTLYNMIVEARKCS